MNNTKKVLSLLLCALMVTASVSCADNAVETENQPSNNDTSTSSETESETLAYLDDLPDNLDFAGTKIRFAESNHVDSIVIDDEAELADIVTEALWKRNNTLTDRLNVVLESSDPLPFDRYNSYVMNSINANSDDYDIFISHARFSINLATLGALKNLDNVENLDLTKDYWSQDYINNIAYKNIHYWATGDISLDYIGDIYCTLANNALFDQLFPGQNIFDYVNEGKWTLDTLETFIEKSYSDLNGNGDADVEDRYGISMYAGHQYNGMLFASDMLFTKWDSDGVPYVAINSEHNYDIITRLGEIFKHNPNVLFDPSNGSIDTLTMFIQQKLLFYPNTLNVITNDNIRNMEDDFCVIPLPKFDETQENYRSSQYDGVPLYGIPITANIDKLPAIGATLEVLCSLGSQNVIPVYFDDALKNKYSRDPETAQMIDLIRDSVVSDFSFSWGDYVGKYGASIQSYFYSNIGSDTFASKLAKNDKFWEKGMNEVLEALEEYADN